MQGDDSAFRLTRTAAGRYPSPARKTPLPVTVERVRPDVLEAALNAAGGDASLLVIKGPRRVEIADARYPKKPR